MTRHLFVNFKTYEQATDSKALRLSRVLEEYDSEKLRVIPCPQPTDIKEISNGYSGKVYSQHVDPVSFGSNTGSIIPEAVKAAGAEGTLLNHAENKRSFEFLSKAVERCRKLGLEVLLCAESVEKAKELAVLKPDFIAFEPPELIGGDVSVSSASPDLIKDTVNAVKDVDSSVVVLTGAGIRSPEDVRVALSLGCGGVLVASGIVKADNQKSALAELIKGFD